MARKDAYADVFLGASSVSMRLSLTIDPRSGAATLIFSLPETGSMLTKLVPPARKDGSRLVSAHSFSRRHLLGGAAALSVGALPFGRARAAGPLTVGFIYVGPKDDYGYNQAHAQGAAALKAMPGVQVVEEENVRETTDVQKTMESMINLDGASLVFPTSFGYFDPHVLIEAKKNPKVQFRIAAGSGPRRTRRMPAPISATSPRGST
jgi:hypothetical protein